MTRQPAMPYTEIVVPHDLVHRFLRALTEELGRSPATAASYRASYTQFRAWLAAQGLTAEKARVGKAQVRGWMADLQARGLAATTIRQKLAALSALFGWMAREGLIRGNPVAAVARPPACKWKPRGALTDMEAGRVWQAAQRARGVRGQQGRVALLLMWDSGARRKEALGADWQDVDLTKRAWFIKHGKGGRQRWVPLSALAVEHLLALWEARGRPMDGAVLRSRTSQRWGRTSLHNCVKRWCRQAGVPHASCHWFRHTFGTVGAEELQSAADLRRLQLLLGHASLETTMGYVHVNPADRGLVDRMSRRGKGGGGEVPSQP